jgi:Fic family protein
LADKKTYYGVLQKVQHNDRDITAWLKWFLHCLKNALLETELSLQKILNKANFWKTHENTPFNERQRFIINKLLYDFEGKLKTSKWAKMTKCSTDTALRDIKDLIDKGVLKQESEGGRSTNYELKQN